MDAHLRDLRYFVAVAEELSFTRAAERLYISQPALSKQIRMLEAGLRARLFVRSPRGIRLTSAGEMLLVSARAVLSAWDEGAAAVAQAASEETRVLRVGTLTGIGRALYPEAIDRFARALPGWRVELRSYPWDDPLAGLGDRSTDAAFVWLPIGDDRLACEVVATEGVCVGMSTSHPLAGRTEVDFSDIANDPIVALPPEAGALRDFWLGTEARRGRPPQVAAVVRTADEAAELVASGAAIKLVAVGNAELYARPGLRYVPVIGLSPARLAVAWRLDERRSVVRAFVDACSSAASDLVGVGG